MIRCGFGALLLCATIQSSFAFAQDGPALRPHRFTISGGITWLGGYDIGRSTAELRGNGLGSKPAPFTLFTADSHLTSAIAPELRIGFSISPRWTIEGGGQWGQPHIGVGISGDAEASARELPGEQLQQYVFDGRLSWQVPLAMGHKLAPYVIGGAAYLRQLHEDRTLGETGEILYGGAGARYWLRGGHGMMRPLGVRGEVRINMRRHGIDFANETRTYPTFSLFAFLGL